MQNAVYYAVFSVYFIYAVYCCKFQKKVILNTRYSYINDKKLKSFRYMKYQSTKF